MYCTIIVALHVITIRNEGRAVPGRSANMEEVNEIYITSTKAL